MMKYHNFMRVHGARHTAARVGERAVFERVDVGVQRAQVNALRLSEHTYVSRRG